MNTLTPPELRTAAISVAAPHVERLVLTGFMGAGKSTVGPLLAQRMGWHFCDTDREIEARYGCSIPDMFRSVGEDKFRRRESVEVARVTGRSQVVVALGGGVLDSLTNRLLLEQASGTTIIFLDAPFAVLFDRCVLQEGALLRPILANPLAAEERFGRRARLYRGCATHSVNTEGVVPEGVAAAILEYIAG